MIKVVVECTPDETLVKNLGFTSNQVKHQPNKGAVCNYLIKNPGIIGMVDADPDSAQPKFFQSCTVFHDKYGITVYQHNTYIYQIKRYCRTCFKGVFWYKRSAQYHWNFHFIMIKVYGIKYINCYLYCEELHQRQMSTKQFS